MPVLRPRRLRDDITAVVFCCSLDDLAAMSVAKGPCVPLTDTARALASVLAQDGGETPALTAALYSALTGRSSATALKLVGREGKGQLSRCSSSFVGAMAAASRETLRLADEDEARGDHKDLPAFQRYQDALSDAWMKAGRWPREVIGLQNRLVRLARARDAEEKGLPLFVWHGPPVPQFVLAQGTGPYPPPD